LTRAIRNTHHCVPAWQRRDRASASNTVLPEVTALSTREQSAMSEPITRRDAWETMVAIIERAKERAGIA
jgi:hypothetical protein